MRTRKNLTGWMVAIPVNKNAWAAALIARQYRESVLLYVFPKVYREKPVLEVLDSKLKPSDSFLIGRTIDTEILNGNWVTLGELSYFDSNTWQVPLMEEHGDYGNCAEYDDKKIQYVKTLKHPLAVSRFCPDEVGYGPIALERGLSFALDTLNIENTTERGEIVELGIYDNDYAADWHGFGDDGVLEESSFDEVFDFEVEDSDGDFGGPAIAAAHMIASTLDEKVQLPPHCEELQAWAQEHKDYIVQYAPQAHAKLKELLNDDEMGLAAWSIDPLTFEQAREALDVLSSYLKNQEV